MADLQAERAAGQFCFEENPLDVQPYGSGHINDTFLVRTPGRRFILQRINTQVFTRPDAVMDNIAAVTTHLHRRIKAAGGSPDRETLTPVPTVHGGLLLRLKDDHSSEQAWRAYRYIDGTHSHAAVQSDGHVESAGAVVGRFLRLLDDFPPRTLHETIPAFHDTSKRMRDFTDAVETDAAGRAGTCQGEIAFTLARAGQVGRITAGLADGSIPLRAAHNDTKLDNVLVDETSGAGLCLVDLDTVMPGSALYDFGDCVRSLASAREDEADLSRVRFDLRRFELFTRAFLGAAGDVLSPAEMRLLPYSAWLMTFECGVRFLADHLNGDVYFKVRQSDHNLVRARNQFQLVSRMETASDDLEAVITRLLT